MQGSYQYADVAQSNQPKPIRNVYCEHKDDRVIPWKCPCCTKCWLYVEGPRAGTCPFNGPFGGFKQEVS